MSNIIKIKIQLEVERDGDTYHAFCLALKGLHVDGATEHEAIETAKEAACAYLVSLMRHGEPLPVGCNVSEVPAPSMLDRIKNLLATTRHHSVTAEVSCAR